MIDSREIVFDAYTAISYKGQFGSRRTIGEGFGFKPPDWIGPEHLRRIQAYSILRAYQDNTAREFFEGDRRSIDSRREYGDAALLVETVVGALLGDDQQIVTKGAEEMALEEPKDPGVDANGDPLPAPEPDPEAEQRRVEAEAAMALQDWLREWAEEERLGLKLIETERLAVGLGDGVYSLGWSGAKKRPRLRVWDPTFYFPVLTDTNEDDFPERVHIAWEVADETLAGKNQIRIRRITWELGDIQPAQREGTVRRLLGSGDQLFKGDRLGDLGKIERDYPWNDGEPSTKTCYYTDATWTIDAGNRSIDDLTESEAVYEIDDEDGQEIRRRDLFLDFLPVVHIPNTVSLLNHYGRSLLSTVLQILDDISSADTDLSAASATTGHPIITLQGATVARDQQGRSLLTYRPGEILESGDGKMDVLDTSKALAALMGYIEFLLSRLSTNSRVAEALLGRIKPSEVPSGIALALGFGPTDALVRGMRLVRTEKYPLMLKFVHRMYQAAQVAGEDVGDVPPEWIHTELVMGSFLPQDQAAVVTQVTALYAAKTISLETAITMLMEVGIPVESVLEEVRRIQERDFKGAAELFDAIGEAGPVFDYLGLEQPPEPPPEPVLVDPSGQPIPPVPETPAGADPTLFGPDGQPLQ
jgi:hypothetical protein